MVEIEKCQLWDTRLNVQSPFARPRILTLHSLMTTNGQLNGTRGYHIKPTNSTCNMISVFSSKRPVLVCAWQNNFCQRSQILIIVEKCY